MGGILDPANLCVGCTLGLGLVAQNPNATSALEDLLGKVCGDSKPACTAAVDLVITLLEAKESPDKICKAVKICPNKDCTLFTSWPVPPPDAPHPDPKTPARMLSVDGSDWSTISSGARTIAGQLLSSVLSPRGRSAPGLLDGVVAAARLTARLRGLGAEAPPAVDLERAAAAALKRFPSVTSGGGRFACGANVSCLVQNVINHLPFFDLDGDAFSTVSQLRGSHWRGRDCDDEVANVYPGRRTTKLPASVDHDCNGIKGGNASGSYEDLFCSATPRRGIISLGDSATAHFHIPPQWLSPTGFGGKDVLLGDVTDELDFPECSWSTGYLNGSTQCPYAPRAPAIATGLPSLASRLRLRNRCNHRDFQNIGVNGMRSSDVMSLVNVTARDPTADHPVLLVFSLLGNDVCNGHPGTTHMTPPADFKKYVLASLEALDAVLPNGSYVIMTGVVDGRVLWNNMHARQHPSGALYEDVYEFLACNGNSPCNGWLNKNETLRNVTSAWAASLNAQYVDIVKEKPPGSYSNIGAIKFYNPDFGALIDKYVSQYGGEGSDLIEPSDGFHPSQVGNELLADELWTWLEAEFPEAIGEVNPHNAEIESMFGDQGGF